MIRFIQKTSLLFFISFFMWNCGDDKIDKATEEIPTGKEEQLNNGVKDEKISVITETYESKSDDGTISAKIEYPQIVGMNNKELQKKINEMLKVALSIDKAIPDDIESSFEGLPQEMKGYNKEGNFTTGIINSYIISFSAYQSEYMAGAAHPTDFIKGYNINPKTGEFYTIDDFIIPTKMDEFNTLIFDKIQQGKCKEAVDGIFDDEMCKFNPEFHSFNFTKKGLEIHLNGCFPHVARFCNEATIPFDKITKLVVKNSPIAEFVE